MSDEIKKAAEQAKSLGIYEIVRNIASNGKNTDEACDSVWENCIVVFECQHGKALQKSDLTASFSAFVIPTTCETNIKMPDGTVLYRARRKGQEVTDFRYGAWVDRITAYSEKITAEKNRADQEKAQKKQNAKLKPFSGIDF